MEGIHQFQGTEPVESNRHRRLLSPVHFCLLFHQPQHWPALPPEPGDGRRWPKGGATASNKTKNGFPFPRYPLFQLCHFKEWQKKQNKKDEEDDDGR